MIAKLNFPWPPKELSPNARVHWAKKNKAKKAYAGKCAFVIPLVSKKRIAGCNTFRLVFCPPDNRRRDADNIIASFKSSFDLISQWTGVDDSKFQWSFARGDVVKGGAVIVEVIK